MMSVKRMVALYVEYGLNERTWNMLYDMYAHGLISYENWSKFFYTCRGFEYSEDGQKIIDTCRNDRVICEANEYGTFHI